MKVSKEHYTIIKSAIARLWATENITKDIIKFGLDAVATHIYMQVFVEVTKPDDMYFAFEKADYNDAHIKTAVKHALKEICLC